jgi:hypothetical protein
VDTRTRHALKKDKFAQAAASSASWIGEHKTSVLRWVILAGVILVLVRWRVGLLDLCARRLPTLPWARRSMFTRRRWRLPGAPPEPGVYTTAADRAKEANREFVAVAHDFGWLPEGSKAHYFAGVTYEELGQNGNAEVRVDGCFELLGPQSFEPREAGACRPLPPDLPRQRRHRSL